MREKKTNMQERMGERERERDNKLFEIILYL